MKTLCSIALLSPFCLAVDAAVVFSQPPDPAGGLYQSSWWDPDGSDYDMYVWDSFTLAADHAITEIQWRGGFLYGGSWSGPVLDFRIEIWPSIGGGSQPNVGGLPLVQYFTGGNAGETYAGTFGGVAMYDYHFVLPAAFQAVAGTKYWVQIEAYHHGIPEWSFAAGTGGNGYHFVFVHGGPYYLAPPGDVAFTLLGSDAPTYTITASAAPLNSGTITGDGAYPVGSTAALLATPNPGFGFLEWTEGGVQVSNSAQYSFTVNANRTLQANFVPAYTITTSAAPTFEGSTGGAGTYNIGSPVTVVATANPGFVFVDWTENGAPVSNSASYSFAASADRALVANFAPGAGAVLFDFDNAPLHSSLPLNLTVGGITASFSATGQGFSIQQANALGFTPANFAGYCIYPNSVFAADLLVGFSQTLTDFSILYSPEEYGCNSSATMRVTAYMNGTLVGTNTATASPPGTWPTATLSFSSAQGFNSVVVHYDAVPPTGGDWGPIFMADNMLVTRKVVLLTGDVNCDGSVNFGDINPFVLYLSNFAGWQAAYPGCNPANGDINQDGSYPSFGDINPFVTLLSGV